jgi:hypothetical protein
MPSGYGQQQPWYFPVLPSYWRRSDVGGSSKRAGAPEDEADGPQQSGVAVAVRHLTKDFATSGGSVKRAVDDLTLDVAAEQVTALLGAVPCLNGPVSAASTLDHFGKVPGGGRMLSNCSFSALPAGLAW